MILSHGAILLFRKLGLIHIDPFRIGQLNPNSYDVRLGEWFTDPGWLGGSLTYTEPCHREVGQYIVLAPGITRLGMTEEVIGTKFCIVAELRGKSSTRRMGVTVCDDAGYGDIGYDNHWTVELTAHTNAPCKIKVGQRFAQVVFTLTTPTFHPYCGQYQSNDWPLNMIPARYRFDERQ